MKHGAICVLLLLFGIGLAVAEEDRPDALPEPVVRAWTNVFPGTVIVRVKAKASGDETRYEIKLTDHSNEKGYEVVFSSAGALLEEGRHALKESDALTTLRFFALFGAADEQTQVDWTVEKEKDASRTFVLRINDCSVPGRLEARVQADGSLGVTLDQRLKEEAGSLRGRFEGRFELAGDMTVLPKALHKAKGTQTAGAGEMPAMPAEEEDLPEEVLRKIRRLIRATLSEDVEERDEGWKQLRNMGKLAVPGLAAVAQHKDTTPEMLDSLMIALGDSKDPRAGPALARLLESASPMVQKGAARAIGDSGYKDGVPGLERLATDPVGEEEARLFAAIAAAKLGSAVGLDVLESLAKSERSATRTRAVFALGKYGGKAHVKTVAAALGDSEAVVRMDAVEALRLIADDEAKVALARAMADSDHRVRAAALAGLRAMTDQQPGSILVGALVSTDPQVRGAAARVLGDLGYKEGLADLEKVLEDTDEQVRLQAAVSAAKLGSGPALLTLKKLLTSSSAEVRAAALVGLGKYGGPAQLEHVAGLLKDGDAKVRLAAVESLSLIGDAGVTRLMDATADQDTLVRDAAVESLQALTGQEIGADPDAWRSWWKKSREPAP